MRALAAVAVLMAALVAGCDYLPVGYTSIGEVVGAPGRFEGEVIKVHGEVVQVAMLPLVDLRSYTLRDDSGEILVLTEGAVPALHERRAIRARVKAIAVVNGHAVGLRLVEIETLPVIGLRR